MALFGPPNVERLVAHQDIRGLIRALDYERDAEVRRQSAEALGLMGDEQALAPLTFRLSDQDLNVRKAAARSLGQLGDARAVPALTGLVEQGPDELAVVAIQALGSIKSAEATPTLIAALVDQDMALREVASSSLSLIGAGAVPALLKKLKETSGDTQTAVRDTLRRMGPEAINDLALQLGDRRNLERAKAAQALGEIGNAQAIEALVKALNSNDLHALPSVMNALAAIGEPSVDPLVAALESESTLLVRSAIDALARIASPRSAGALRRVAATRNPVLRELALNALARIPDESAMEPLLEQLRAETWTARRQAAIALGRANPEQAIPALIGALTDPEASVRRAAAASLDLHKWRPSVVNTDPAAAAGYYVALRHWDKAANLGVAAIVPLLGCLEDAAWDDRRAPTDALIKIGAPAVTPLIAALGHEESGVRHSAAYALGRIKPAPAEGEELEAQAQASDELKEGLQDLLADKDESVRAAASRSLGLLGVTEAIALLVERLHDTPAVRVNAADALAMLGDEAIATLTHALSDDIPAVRAAVADALGNSKHVAAVGPLIDSLTDEQDSVRGASARSLTRLGDLAVPILVERLGPASVNLQLSLCAILGSIGNQAAVPALYGLLGSEETSVRLTAATALHNLWIASRESAEPLRGVSSLFVMTFTPTPEDEDLQRWLISESFADLASGRPDITEVHTLVMVDLSRLHESFRPLPQEGYAFEPMVEQFRAWMAEQGVALEEWEQRFYHREIMTGESTDTHVTCLYYAL